MTKIITVFVVLSLFLSCSESANDNSHLRDEQRQIIQEKLPFPFVSKEDVDTSKMIKIDYPVISDLQSYVFETVKTPYQIIALAGKTIFYK